MTARLKEVLEDTKKELVERDQQLKALEAQHNSASAAGLWRLIEEEEAAGLPGCRVCDVVARVNPEVLAGGEGISGSSWCYVLGKGTGGAVRWRGWVQESDLIKHAPDVTLPASLSSTRDAVDQVR